MRNTGIGRTIFAAIIIVIGIQGLVVGEFGAIWQPVPPVPARQALIYACVLASLVGGIGLLWRRAWAAAGLLGLLLLWFAAFRLPVILRAPASAVSWEGGAETLVLAAGAWSLFAAGKRGRRMASLLYGLALIPFGVAHFAYPQQTAALVPHWLPSPTAWVYFTGAAYIAAGLAIVSGVRARTAAMLSALQMGLFTLLVWVPMAAAGAHDAGTWNELLDSAALTAAGWAVAEALG
jgi:uncharacterized membrane protein